MLSYRHSYHAGNHADVLKHLTQMLILNKLNDKAKPYTYFDTHSGAALYSLKSSDAPAKTEFHTGIEKIMSSPTQNEVVRQYQSLVRPFWDQFCYPGSPNIASQLMRENDVAILCELHTTDIQILERNMKGKGAKIHHRDGFEALVALLPPKPARGMVLIDPPYELANEYNQVSKTLEKAIKRWQTGIFAVWYPLLSERAEEKRLRCTSMINAIADLDVKSVLQVELSVEEDTYDAGMYGSGMVIINPPWQLDEQLKTSLPELIHTLSRNIGQYSIDWLKTE